LVSVVGLTHKFFSIINWVDDVITQLDDVTILLKKRIFFFFCSGVYYQFKV